MFPMIMQAGAALIGGVMSGMHASRQASRAKARANAAQRMPKPFLGWIHTAEHKGTDY